MTERDDYGMVKIGRRYYRMTGRGFIVYLIVSSFVGVFVLWGVLVLCIFAFSPLYG